MERDIAARTFRFVPARQADQARPRRIARGVMRRPGGAASAAGRGAQTLVERRPRPERPLSATPLRRPRHRGPQRPRRRPARARGSPLAQPMAVRVDGLPIAPERAALAAAFPARDPAPRRLPPRPDGDRVRLAARRRAREDYGARLARDLGVTPVYVRYNSGRHVSENGRSLADLLEALVAAWPVAVERDRARRPLDGRPRRPQRRAHAALDEMAWLAPRPPRGLARHAAHGRAARAGRPLRRARRSAGCRRRARSAASCAAAAPASATCDRARWSTTTGATATPTRCAPRPARRSRCSRARRTASSPPRSRAARATRSGACSATRSCWRRAPRARPRRRIGFDDEYGLHVGGDPPPRAAEPPGGLREASAGCLADYPHVLDIPTRWKDNDVYGHVNNVEYYSYFDTVINRWLIAEGGLDIHGGEVIGLCGSRTAVHGGDGVPRHRARRAAGGAPRALERPLRDRALPRGRPEPAAEGWFVHVFVDRADAPAARRSPSACAPRSSGSS